MTYGKPLRPDSYAEHTLRRYSGSEPGEFQRFVLLTNFNDYTERFKTMGECTVSSGNWEAIHNPELECSMINFGIGSPLAAMVMHCLGYLDNVDAVIMLGLAGGLAEEVKIGDFVLPTASIRDEGSSGHYLHDDVPALPNFKVQSQIAHVAKALGVRTRSGLCKTTDYRMWEFDADFSLLLKQQRVVAIDMEISALFSVGYALGKPVGALMLVSDLPFHRSGIKTSNSTSDVLGKYCEKHLDIGIKTVEGLKQQAVFNQGAVLPFEW